MPYITQTRASTGVLTVHATPRTRNSASFVRPEILHVGNITTMVDGAVWRVTPLYTYPGDVPYGSLGGVVGQQTTYSWRTGKSSYQEGGKGEDLTGQEMRDLIYKGYDINIEPDVSGTDRIIDRRGMPMFGHTDYSSFDNGHEFWTEKTVHLNAVDRYKQLIWPVRIQTGTGYQYDILDWWGYPPSSDALPWVVPPALSQAQRHYVGNRLYKSALPTRPYSQTVRAIGEIIKDGLSLPFLALGNAGANLGKGAGGEYLSWQFGILPTIADIRKLLEAVVKSSEITSQYAAQSGKWLRRERKLDEPQQSWTQEEPYTGFHWSAAYGGPNGSEYDLGQFIQGLAGTKRNGVATFTRSHRFVGEFSYALPDGDDAESRMSYYAAQANHLLGLQLTPDVLFDLLPFSWLTDWIFDYGTVLDNAVAQGTDCLVGKYGYVMTHDVHKSSTMVTGLKGRMGEVLPPFMTADTLIERKYRDRATPFGFGVNPGSLTNFQWSILAALGLTRGRNVKLAEPL